MGPRCPGSRSDPVGSLSLGLGAQKVVRAVPATKAKHIARVYVASELGVKA